MSARLVAHVAAGSADNNSLTTGSVDTTGADLLVVVVANAQSKAAAILSDSKSNTWTALTARTVSGQGRVQIFYATNPTVGSGHTFTTTTVTASSPSIAAMAFVGMATSSPFDAENGGSTAGTTGSQATGSITPAVDNELIIAGLASSAGGSWYIDGIAEVPDQILLASSLHFGVVSAFGVQGTAGAVNLTFTTLGSPLGTNPAAAIASFKIASDAPAGFPVINNPIGF